MSEVPASCLVFSFDYPPNDGGIARFCASLAEANANRGLRVSVLAQDVPGGRSAENRPVVETVQISGSRLSRDLAAFRRLIGSSDESVVVAGIWYPEGLIATLAGVRPLVILAHGSELMPTIEAWRRGIWRQLARWVLSRADLVVANSSYTLDLVQRLAPRSSGVAIPLGVDVNRFCPGDRVAAREAMGVDGLLVISTVARLVRYKGHGVVLRALANLDSELQERVVYLVAGDGPDRLRLETLSEELGVRARVRWLDFLPESDLPMLYRASDLFVLCSREEQGRQEVEGFGLAFLEAQACGTPVVGTRTGGIPDAVKEGEGGWLIEQNDHVSLTEILRRLVEQPELFRQAGAVARARVVRGCTWDQYVSRLWRELEKKGVGSV